ncbi:hypothetical protein GQR58_029231 [Nymphon striatum]|nr:hypothetical protein GQR58_029231 [Nymphon striatum]
MEALTQQLWELQNRHQGDRFRFFTAVSTAVEADRVLYPGSFVDVAASMVFDDVTYVDVDKRFPKFFADEAGVNEIIDASRDHAGPVLRACCARRLPGRSRHRRRVRRPAGIDLGHDVREGWFEGLDEVFGSGNAVRILRDVTRAFVGELGVAREPFVEPRSCPLVVANQRIEVHVSDFVARHPPGRIWALLYVRRKLDTATQVGGDREGQRRPRILTPSLAELLERVDDLVEIHIGIVVNGFLGGHNQDEAQINIDRVAGDQHLCQRNSSGRWVDHLNRSELGRERHVYAAG